MYNNYQQNFMDEAVLLSKFGIEQRQGGPFGCVIVKEHKIVGRGWNQVLLHNDPTAHAEVIAIRNACEHLQTRQLTDCDIYTSCEPCPMCLGAIYWARPSRVFYANTREDAARVGFDDSFIYNQINIPHEQKAIPFLRIEDMNAGEIFKKWIASGQKGLY